MHQFDSCQGKRLHNLHQNSPLFKSHGLLRLIGSRSASREYCALQSKSFNSPAKRREASAVTFLLFGKVPHTKNKQKRVLNCVPREFLIPLNGREPTLKTKRAVSVLPVSGQFAALIFRSPRALINFCTKLAGFFCGSSSWLTAIWARVIRVDLSDGEIPFSELYFVGVAASLFLF